MTCLISSKTCMLVTTRILCVDTSISMCALNVEAEGFGQLVLLYAQMMVLAFSLVI